MANANVLELETCIEECIAYCAAHPEHDFVAFYAPRLEHARDRWNESVALSDEHYLAWQREVREDRVAWKRLATELKATQDKLHRHNAIGFPDDTVRHWDEEILAAAVEAMLDYLRARTDVLTIAAERIEVLDRALSAAKGEDRDAETALRSFKRHVQFRAAALGTLVATIGDFRVAMRRAMGKKSEQYRSIRWPMTVAPDEPVL